MSAFLGPIHYWLYNKVLWHEGLLCDLLDLAQSKGISVKETLANINSKYGAPDTSPLESVIDQGNIHGWLQARIQSVEYRIAAIATELVRQEIPIDELTNTYTENGKKAAKTITQAIKAPKDLFKLVFDFMLEGMPCDHVNEVVSDTEDELSWETTSCLHKTFWAAVAGDVNHFYRFQEAWITSFVSAVDENYVYTHEKDGLKSIKKR